MPSITDYSVCSFSDGVLTLSLAPPTAIGGWTIRFQLVKRPGGTPVAERWVSSGMNGQSGITITDSGVGRMNIELRGADVSGRDAGNYYYKADRVSGGSNNTRLAEGYQITGA